MRARSLKRRARSKNEAVSSLESGCHPQPKRAQSARSEGDGCQLQVQWIKGRSPGCSQVSSRNTKYPEREQNRWNLWRDLHKHHKEGQWFLRKCCQTVQQRRLQQGVKGIDSKSQWVALSLLWLPAQVDQAVHVWQSGQWNQETTVKANGRGSWSACRHSQRAYLAKHEELRGKGKGSYHWGKWLGSLRDRSHARFEELAWYTGLELQG